MPERLNVTYVTSTMFRGETWGYEPGGGHRHHDREGETMTTVLWIIAVIIAIFGIVRLVRGDILFGIILLIVAALVGPGGVSVFT